MIKTIRKTNKALLAAAALAGGVMAGTPAFTTQADIEDALAEGLRENNRAVLRALDKITGRITEMEVGVGEEVIFGTLRLKVHYCRSRPPIEPPESFTFLEIHDKDQRGGGERAVFKGWMLASSPALNPLEHPVYDVWLIACKMSEPDAPTGIR